MTSPESSVLEESERLRLMRVAVAQGVFKGLDTVRTRFDNAPNRDNRLAYHNVAHTEGVVARTGAIMAVIERTAPQLAGERETMLANLAVAFHDTVQEWDPVHDSKLGFTKRVRRKVTNEAASADEAVAFMEAENQKLGLEIFTQVDKDEVRAAIMATVPDWDSKHKTVVQSGVTGDASVITRAVTLADLGLGGMEPEKVVDEGRRVFREDHIEIERLLASGDALDPATEARIHALFIESSARQLEFIAGRKALFENEIAAFPPATQEGLRALFGGFHESLRLLEEDVEHVKKLSFAELRKVMGY